MSITEVLFNAASGGILGSLLHCVTDYFDTKNKITLMNAQINAAEKTEAWKAFSASQTEAPIQIPQTTWPWVASIYLLVDCLRNATRPLLTWASVGIVVMVYTQSTVADRAAITSELIFGSFTAIFWWFGARYAAKSK